MYRIIIISFILIFSSLSCSLNENREEGIITGPDIRECACCGGYFIKINNDTYRFFDLPKGSDIKLENFPIHVDVEWAMQREPCLGDEIIIIEIDRIE